MDGERHIPEATRRQSAQEKPHLTQYGGQRYDVQQLKQVAEPVPTTMFDLGNTEAINDIVQSKYWDTSEGQSIGPSDLIEAYQQQGMDWNRVLEAHPTWSLHIEKVRRVDYRVPALVYDGHLIDGIHRLTKALCEGAHELPVKVLPELPEEAQYHQ